GPMRRRTRRATASHRPPSRPIRAMRSRRAPRARRSGSRGWSRCLRRYRFAVARGEPVRVWPRSAPRAAQLSPPKFLFERFCQWPRRAIVGSVLRLKPPEGTASRSHGRADWVAMEHAARPLWAKVLAVLAAVIAALVLLLVFF